MKQVKKILVIIFALVLSISMLPTANVNAAAKVKLNKKKVTIYVGKTVTLKLKNNKKKVKWSSSNKRVATVSKKGKVKGEKAGKATITAQVGKKKYKCKVTVKKKVVKKPVVQTTQPTTKPVGQTTTQPTILIPTEVVGASIVKQDKAEVSFMWSQNATQGNTGQSYKVYIDGMFYNQYPMPTTITYKFTSVGSHTIRITGVLNGLETTGVTLNVSVTDLGDTSGNTTTQQPTTQAPTTQIPNSGDMGDSGADWIVEGSSTKVYIKGYIGTDTDIVVPSMIQGKEVIGIKAEAFEYNTDITSIVLPDTITEIEESSFYWCESLESVTIPSGVTSIGDMAFSYCSSLTSVTIPNSVTSIGNHAFNSCSSLTNVTIPNSVISMGYMAFGSCSSLTSITISNGVTSIGNRAFYGCDSLTSVTIPNSVTSIGDNAFIGCSSLTSVTIPNSVISIGATPFSCTINNKNFINNSNFEDRELGIRVFDTYKDGLYINNNKIVDADKDIESITIPNSVKSIGDGAFSDCSSLTSVTIPNSVTSIGNYAFVGCGLTDIIIPESVTSIGAGAFNAQYYIDGTSSDKLKTITILNPNTIFYEEYIGDSAYITFLFLTGEYLGQQFKYDRECVIKAPKGSTAETFAKKYEVPFIEI